MPSPFPGMDPFIECGPWSDFHTSAIAEIRRGLNRELPDGYAARVEQRVYVDDDPPEIGSREVAPDAIVFESPESAGGHASQAGTLAVSQTLLWPMPVEHHESWLEVRDERNSRIITLIELLSPSNKRSGAKGRRLYLRKRRRVLESRTHFIEIDLLRGGGTVWPAPPHPEGDYYAAVSRAEKRPKVQVFSWSLRDRLPSIAIPLKAGTPEIILNLQEVLDRVYDDGRYGPALYEVPLVPKLSVDDQAWVNHLLLQHANDHAH